MNKLTISLLVSALISAYGVLFAVTEKQIAKKANNETIMVIVQNMEKQREEDKEEVKEQRQDIKNIYQIIQQMLIDREKESK
jgi:hypothetical protein